MTETVKLTARVDVGPHAVDVDWGDGTAEQGVHGVLHHDYPPGLTVEITLTDPVSRLTSGATVTVPGTPRPPQVQFDTPDKPQHKAAHSAPKKSKSEGGPS